MYTYIFFRGFSDRFRCPSGQSFKLKKDIRLPELLLCLHSSLLTPTHLTKFQTLDQCTFFPHEKAKINE